MKFISRKLFGPFIVLNPERPSQIFKLGKIAFCMTFASMVLVLFFIVFWLSSIMSRALLNHFVYKFEEKYTQTPRNTRDSSTQTNRLPPTVLQQLLPREVNEEID